MLVGRYDAKALAGVNGSSESAAAEMQEIFFKLSARWKEHNVVVMGKGSAGLVRYFLLQLHFQESLTFLEAWKVLSFPAHPPNQADTVKI